MHRIDIQIFGGRGASGGGGGGNGTTRIGASAAGSAETVTYEWKMNFSPGLPQQVREQIQNQMYYKIEVGIPKYEAASEKQAKYATDLAQKQIRSTLAGISSRYDQVPTATVLSEAKKHGIKNPEKNTKNKMVNLMAQRNATIKFLTSPGTKAREVIDKYGR